MSSESEPLKWTARPYIAWCVSEVKGSDAYRYVLVLFAYTAEDAIRQARLLLENDLPAPPRLQEVRPPVTRTEQEWVRAAELSAPGLYRASI